MQNYVWSVPRILIFLVVKSMSLLFKQYQISSMQHKHKSQEEGMLGCPLN